MPYVAVGFAFAYGGTSGVILPSELNQPFKNTFIGFENFFLIDYDNYGFWMYQFACAATSTTIVAGTLAERSQIVAYFLYSTLLSGFVYPGTSKWSEIVSALYRLNLWRRNELDSFPYLIYAFAHETVNVPPVIAHAVWSIEGFLNASKANRLFGSGMIDFAGSGVVHVRCHVLRCR